MHAAGVGMGKHGVAISSSPLDERRLHLRHRGTATTLHISTIPTSDCEHVGMCKNQRTIFNAEIFKSLQLRLHVERVDVGVKTHSTEMSIYVASFENNLRYCRGTWPPKDRQPLILPRCRPPRSWPWSPVLSGPQAAVLPARTSLAGGSDWKFSRDLSSKMEIVSPWLIFVLAPGRAAPWVLEELAYLMG